MCVSVKPFIQHWIDTVLFTGVATNVTVEGTARDAVNLAYHTILISDACAAATDQAHEATLATFSLLGRTATAAHIALRSRGPQQWRMRQCSQRTRLAGDSSGGQFFSRRPIRVNSA